MKKIFIYILIFGMGLLFFIVGCFLLAQVFESEKSFTIMKLLMSSSMTLSGVFIFYIGIFKTKILSEAEASKRDTDSLDYDLPP